ncbi:MAG TPA: c-type cytochrome, partial [Burkholderiales bacterium]|nr:c-type cytochrome [Burkholderiales bacterium]
MRTLVALVLLACFVPAAAAQEAQTILHLLDYIGVDYPEAVEDGRVKNADEYNEMVEFTGQVAARLAALPAHPRKAELESASDALSRLVAEKATPASVAAASAGLRWAIVEAYQLKLAPRVAPDLARGAELYAQHCATCHGASGEGNGPAATGLEPPPSNFHDLDRMAQRSIYGLYNTITLGVEGTSMPSFRQFSDQERWALAFFVAGIGIPSERVQEGARAWDAGAGRSLFADLAPVATISTNEISERHGAEAARVQDYLRAHPQVLRPAPLAFSRQKLAEASDAYARGERAVARDAAITAYLEGFELVEAALANVDAGLMRDIERRMLAFRADIESGAPLEDLKTKGQDLDALLAAAQETLGEDGLSEATAFTASLVILLREGLEAILVLGAIIAFVVKTGRRDALPWVHAGWIAALLLGGATWLVATYAVEISGANREITEGVTALLAAAMLLYVGWWLHGKSYAEAWSRFIKAQVGQ